MARDYTAREAHSKWAAGEVVIIDVREQREHDQTRIDGVPLIPMSELLERIDELPTEAELVFICRSGSRSARVADHVNAQGEHGDAVNLEGGIIAWAAEGLPYEGEPPS